MGERARQSRTGAAAKQARHCGKGAVSLPVRDVSELSRDASLEDLIVPELGKIPRGRLGWNPFRWLVKAGGASLFLAGQSEEFHSVGSSR